MRSNKNIKFTYIPTTHSTVCQRKIHNKIYMGIAKCHPNDYDFESKLVGEHYAYVRSIIDELRSKRDVIKFELKALRHLYDIFEQNPFIRETSTECFLTKRQIEVLEEDLDDIRMLIKATQSELREMMQQKDDLYEKIRKNRNKDKNKEDTNSGNG